MATLSKNLLKSKYSFKCMVHPKMKIMHTLSASVSVCLPWDCRQSCLSGCRLPCLRPYSLQIALTIFLTSLGTDSLKKLLSFASASWDFNQYRKQAKYLFFSTVVLTDTPCIFVKSSNYYQPVWTRELCACVACALTEVLAFREGLRTPSSAPLTSSHWQWSRG